MTARMVLMGCLLRGVAVFAEPSPNVLALETRWTAEDGHGTTLGAWRGKRYVVSFIYTSCASTCPLTTQKLKRLEAALTKAGKPLDVVVVSLDPIRDTPSAVKQYRVTHALTKAARWHVLVGEEAELRTLTMMLGFRYAKNPETGVILHDNSVYLIGPGGEVETSMSSLDQAMTPFVDAVLKGRAGAL